MTRAAVAAACAIASAGTAHADVPADRPAATDRDEQIDRGAPRPAWWAGLELAWLEAPLGEAVRRRERLAVGAGIAVGESVVLDARLAGSHQVGARLRPADPRRLDRAVLHDLRLAARVHVVGGAARAAFVRAELTLPTGDDRDFAGDAAWSLAWRLIGRTRLGDSAALSGSLGIRLRGEEVVAAGHVIGDELLGAVGLEVAVRPQLTATADLLAALGNDVGGGQGPSPVEARLGAGVRVSDRLGLAAQLGAGVNHELGAPRWTALISATFGATFPPAAATPGHDQRIP